MSLIKITPKKVKILFRLYTEAKKIPSGTIKDIAEYLDGVNRTSDTYAFLSDCVRLSILELAGEIEINQRFYPVYKVNKDKLIFFWKNRIEFKLSEQILDDESMFGAVI